jgi:hypothetical protein
MLLNGAAQIEENALRLPVSLVRLRPKACLQKPLEHCDTRLQVSTPDPENSEDSALQHFTFFLDQEDGKGFNILVAGSSPDEYTVFLQLT